MNGVTIDPSVISRDQSQTVFQQSFEQFSGRMISPDRVRKGANMLKRYGSVLERIEGRFGVPAPVLIAIWGLETDLELIRVDSPPFDHWQHSPMTVDARKHSVPNC